MEYLASTIYLFMAEHEIFWVLVSITPPKNRRLMNSRDRGSERGNCKGAFSEAFDGRR
jgi:hypothetical protein